MVSVFTSGFVNTETILHFFNKQQSTATNFPLTYKLVTNNDSLFLLDS